MIAEALSNNFSLEELNIKGTVHPLGSPIGNNAIPSILIGCSYGEKGASMIYEALENNPYISTIMNGHQLYRGMVQKPSLMKRCCEYLMNVRTLQELRDILMPDLFDMCLSLRPFVLSADHLRDRSGRKSPSQLIDDLFGKVGKEDVPAEDDNGDDSDDDSDEEDSDIDYDSDSFNEDASDIDDDDDDSFEE